MVGEVSWILGFPERMRVTDLAEFMESCQASELIYGGFLWADLKPEDHLQRFHQRFLLDFQVGWSAAGPAARGPADLGAWSAPTSARAHRAAPYGLYLLSGERLLKSLDREQLEVDLSSSSSLSLRIHRQQRQLGPIFCDPLMEVAFESAREFHYRPPSKWSRLRSASRFLIKGMEV